MKLEEAINKFNMQKVSFNDIEKYKIMEIKKIDKEMTIPGKIDDIDVELSSKLFASNKTCKKIIIEEGITSIPDCFACDSNVEEVILPKSIKEIWSYAFDYSLLRKINLENVETIGNSAFVNCNLEEVNLENVKCMEPCTFSDCKNLKKVELSNKISVLKNYAFKNTNIEEIDLKNVKLIGHNVFCDCNNLKYVKGDNVENITTVNFCKCHNLEKISFENISRITNVGFIDCNINTLSINSDVIINEAFKYCNIKKLILNKKSQLYDSFEGCNIEKIIANGDILFCSPNFENSAIEDFTINGRIKIDDYYRDECFLNADIYALNLYNNTKNTDTIKELLKENILINAYNGVNYNAKNSTKVCTYDELINLGFNSSQNNQILKAQQNELLLSCMPIETSVDTLRTIIEINNKDPNLANELKWLLVLDCSLDAKLRAEKILSDYCEDKKQNNINNKDIER